ncbi:MAG: hypothetical protein KIT37_07960 [Steroidobacteraceae bacterium]|nr:hypothetical protein [Steroidobacteraceae bacterium]
MDAARKPAKMVGWFDPRVLAQTAMHMTMANVFGRHSDSRLIEALSSQPQGHFDYSDAGADGLWLDYVADTGDGWNPTHAVADALARPVLELAGQVRTQSGRALVFGGDQVYPWPSRQAYAWRTEWPYETAFAAHGTRPDIFAIPGNHDWFDSLVAFSRTFCRPERGFAGCRTQQTRSYFALRLPADWWLVAVDLQLGAELDEPQVQYLKRTAASMAPGAQVILCVPEPQWAFEDAYPGHQTYAHGTLETLEREILQRPVRAFIAGDLHHYRRHENAAGVQKIISGGGGAFLHPTHAPRMRDFSGGFIERAVYPDRATSRRLAWRNLAFPKLNPQGLVLPAVLYALSAWFASASLVPADLDRFGATFAASLTAAVRDPVNGLWLLAIIAGFVFFTDTHERWYRVIGGTGHAVAHLAAALGLAWLAAVLTTQLLGLAFGSIAQLLIAGAITFVCGGIVGGLLIGVYLLVSVQLFGRHANEAFSSLRIEDYKQWLRLHVAADGTLTIHAIGIDRVSRHRRDGAQATPPHLIDKVVLQR